MDQVGINNVGNVQNYKQTTTTQTTTQSPIAKRASDDKKITTALVGLATIGAASIYLVRSGKGAKAIAALKKFVGKGGAKAASEATQGGAKAISEATQAGAKAANEGVQVASEASTKVGRFNPIDKAKEMLNNQKAIKQKANAELETLIKQKPKNAGKELTEWQKCYDEANARFYEADNIIDNITKYLTHKNVQI